MSFTPIINSLLDEDLYKLTMWQAMLHAFPGNTARYRFVCRNAPQFALSRFEEEVRRQVAHLCTLRFTEADLTYLSTKPYFKPDFIDFLRIFRFQERYINIYSEGETLCIEPHGPQIHCMGFEIFVLAIVNEVYFRQFDQEQCIAVGRERLRQKIDLLRGSADRLQQRHPFEFFDFGTRRRFSRDWHQEVVTTLHREVPGFFKGTSNMELAKQLGIPAIGTMAHEYLQTYQAVGVQLRKFQVAALEGWVQEYRGDLGIALTDVVGFDAFLRDFDLYFAKLFDGLRHDSGDPVEWGEKALAHYAKLRIDAHTKRLVFSDGLTVPKAIALQQHFGERTQCGFGIGTDLTNDVGVPALNIVLKLVECNGAPVAKISDTAGKTICTDQPFLDYLSSVFNR